MAGRITVWPTLRVLVISLLCAIGSTNSELLICICRRLWKQFADEKYKIFRSWLQSV